MKFTYVGDSPAVYIPALGVTVKQGEAVESDVDLGGAFEPAGETLSDLRAQATDAGVKGAEKMKKADLIAALAGLKESK